jgi:mono/diheme cytochrome c family protein
VIDLFKNIRNPASTQPTSVADFIKLLPQGMRSNFALMTESRSFQESTYQDPRVLMKSENSGVIASFTGHGRGDKLRGSEKMEFIVWNGPEARYDFYEVDFPTEDPYKDPATLTEAQKRPTVKQNPASCLNCHGSSVGTGDTLDLNGEIKYVQGALGDKVLDSSNARPNWDTYNFWQGQLPFNRDTVFKDSEESRRYLALLKKMGGAPVDGEERNPRLEALLPRFSPEDVTKAMDKDGYFEVPDYQNGDGPGVSLFDQSSRLNFCRIGQNLKKLPFYENLKYAIPAAVQGCDMTTILPPEAREYSAQYFKRLGINDLPALQQQTGALQQSVAKDKGSRQRQTFTRLFTQNNPGMVQTEIAALVETELNRRGQMENREDSSNAEPLAALRYLLEPMGVQVANWSMSIDSGTYSFADVLNLSDGAFRNGEGLSCEDLAKRTGEVFFSSRPRELRQAYLNACEKATMPVTLEDFSAQNVTIAAAQVNQNVQQVFVSCNGCHKSGAGGAPRLPFNDLTALSELIRSSASLPNGGLGASIINRINKPEGAKGHMPMGPRTLTTQEKQYVRDFIGLARGQ